MNKCVESIAMGNIRKISVVMAKGRTMKAVKEETGCDYIMSGGLFDERTDEPKGYLVINGKVKSKDPFRQTGLLWDKGPDMYYAAVNDLKESKNAISGNVIIDEFCDLTKEPLCENRLKGKQGRSAVGLTKDRKRLVLFCVKDKSSYAMTAKAVQRELDSMKVEAAIMLVCGQYAQCDFGNDNVILSNKKVNNFFCVWLKDKAKDQILNRVAKQKKESHKYNYRVTTTGNIVNARLNPVSSSKIVGYYRNGEIVRVTDKKNGFYKTHKGWCSSKNFTRIDKDSSNVFFKFKRERGKNSM